jgi:hypothetical protein
VHHPAAEDLQPIVTLAEADLVAGAAALDVDLGRRLVNGKKDGRNRIFTSSTSKNALQNSSSTQRMLAMVAVLSITRPSTWWNIGVWVWSESCR